MNKILSIILGIAGSVVIVSFSWVMWALFVGF